MIRRRGAPVEEESSSEEEDAFSTLISRDRKGSKQRKDSRTETSGSPKRPTNSGVSVDKIITKDTDKDSVVLPVSNTSSMKRHHGTSGTRKAKMDALLQELEKEKVSNRRHDRFVPDKKGSFVQPGEEHMTTNIFVGNLAPSITEEEMTDLFRQFGDLYSLKIMWPRTPEERARNRNTGFVCFMNRSDAEEAMETLAESDPFNVGRQLMLRWGKQVKKIVKRGTGGIAPIRKKQLGPVSTLPDAKRQRIVAENDALGSQSSFPFRDESSSDPSIQGARAIRVALPQDPRRRRFITTIASFVAKDGSALEQKLIDHERNNPNFSFLSSGPKSPLEQREDHVFYRWRVFAFCQGDGFENWRTEPFVMIKPHGDIWIPPSLDEEAAWREKQAQMEREQHVREQKAQRRRIAGRKDYMTGRQLEQLKTSGRGSGGGSDGGVQLTDNELRDFNDLVRVRLCASRGAICDAMAFCFEKSGAAKQISASLKELLTDSNVGLDSRVARLFLISDILFNSQQPGVKNAFLYRDAIERMAPDVFTSMGKHGRGKVGRMTLNKLRMAVSSVLSAWTNWSVYNSIFIDELEARFEGREIPPKEAAAAACTNTAADKDGHHEDPLPNDDGSNMPPVVNRPLGDWVEVSEDSTGIDAVAASPAAGIVVQKTASLPVSSNEVEEIADERFDGSPMDERADGYSIGKGLLTSKDSDRGAIAQGESLEGAEDVDGESIDGESLDDLGDIDD